MDTDKTYGPKAVCRSVGISQRQLGYWSLIGVIKPKKQTRGSKILNRYTDDDIETLKKVKKLTDEGFFVSKAAEKVYKGTDTSDTTPSRPNTIQSDEGQWADVNRNRHEGLSSSLYLEVRFYEEISQIQQFPQPLSCMAARLLFPTHFKPFHEKNRILFELSKRLASRKAPSDVISYKKDYVFIWLLPNRTLDEAHLFSKEIKKFIEEPEVGSAEAEV